MSAPAPKAASDSPPLWEIFIPLLIAFSGVWVAIGRIFAGSGGWLIIILFPVGVVIAVYAAVLGATLGFFAHSRHYRLGLMSRLFGTSLGVLIFVVGFTVVDFGDTDDSGVSVLTNIAGASSATDPLPTIFDVSQNIAMVSSVLSLVLSIALIVSVLVEYLRTPKPAPTMPYAYPYPTQGSPPPFSPPPPPWSPPRQPPPGR